MSVFYNSPVLTTSGYLARAVVNNVLKESETLMNSRDPPSAKKTVAKLVAFRIEGVNFETTGLI